MEEPDVQSPTSESEEHTPDSYAQQQQSLGLESRRMGMGFRKGSSSIHSVHSNHSASDAQEMFSPDLIAPKVREIFELPEDEDYITGKWAVVYFASS